MKKTTKQLEVEMDDALRFLWNAGPLEVKGAQLAYEEAHRLWDRSRLDARNSEHVRHHEALCALANEGA